MPSSELLGIPCVIMRGGTSRGVFLRAADLPADLERRDRVIAAVFGSPHHQQIDGIGGAAVVTSKLAIVGPPSRTDADIDFTFVQVGVDHFSMDATGTCGNLSSAVGPYAVDEGYVSVQGPSTTVRIHDTNTGRIMLSEVQTADGSSAVEGGATIAGVNGTGAPVVLNYADLVGATTGELLPSGNAIDEGPGGTAISMVDVSAPVVHVAADDVGLIGTELPGAFGDVTETLEVLRRHASETMGITARYGAGSRLPFVNVVSAPRSYETLGGEIVDEGDVDLVVRLRAVNRMHKALAATVAVNIAATAATKGSVVNDICGWSDTGRGTIRLGHPSGVMEVDVEGGAGGQFQRLAYVRTARRVMDGTVYVRRNML